MHDIENGYYNLQIMKLSSYYKNKKEIVSLISDLSKYNLYSKIFYFQNREDLPFHPLLSVIPNVTLCGRAFSNNRYNSLDDITEKQQPDIYLYQHLIKQLNLSDKAISRYKKCDKGKYVQISSDGINPYKYRHICLVNTRNILFVNDIEIVKINNWENILKNSLDSEYQYVSFCNEQQCYNREQLIQFSHFIYSSTSQDITIKYNLNKNEIKYIANNLPQTFLTYVYYHIATNNKNGESLRKELYDTVNYILYMKSNNKTFNIKYDWQYTNFTANYFAKYLAEWNNDRGEQGLLSYIDFHKHNKQAMLVTDLVLKSMPELNKKLNINPSLLYKRGDIYLL